jgi:hypothetical protein
VKIEYAVPCRGIEALVGGQYVAVGVEANAAVAPQLPMTIVVMLLICTSRGATNSR